MAFPGGRSGGLEAKTIHGRSRRRCAVPRSPAARPASRGPRCRFRRSRRRPSCSSRKPKLIPTWCAALAKSMRKSRAFSRWGFDVVRKAREASDRTGLPLYFHTGELFEVDEARRPEPRSLLPEILAIARPGDILGHIYSAMPDGVLGSDQAPSAALIEPLTMGCCLISASASISAMR